jgi:hypothetical protein
MDNEFSINAANDPNMGAPQWNPVKQNNVIYLFIMMMVICGLGFGR